ncbi:hypothetical protein NM688_g1174 [Phlebia brevispora]|uniref:Uncharacterized protein n=1 Tax=Phlebia brevispora TaxID=194682 RepID=A0ACC1TCH2_9APHY|nr:hypothetical protein NM688_g1174 [Phlebia brevispora]
MANEPTIVVNDDVQEQHQLFVISVMTAIIAFNSLALVIVLAYRYDVASSGINTEPVRSIRKILGRICACLASMAVIAAFATQSTKTDSAWAFNIALFMPTVLIVFACQLLLGVMYSQLFKRKAVGIYLLAVIAVPCEYLNLVDEILLRRDTDEGIAFGEIMSAILNGLRARIDWQNNLLCGQATCMAHSQVAFDLTMSLNLADAVLFLLTVTLVPKGDQQRAAQEFRNAVVVGFSIAIWLSFSRMFAFIWHAGVGSWSFLDFALTIGIYELNAALYPAFMVYVALCRLRDSDDDSGEPLVMLQDGPVSA